MNTEIETIRQIAGAIFFSLLSLWDDQAERDAIGHLKNAIEAGSVTDPYAILILEGIISASESKDLSCIPAHVLKNILQTRGGPRDGDPGADDIIKELMMRRSGGSA